MVHRYFDNKSYPFYFAKPLSSGSRYNYLEFFEKNLSHLQPILFNSDCLILSFQTNVMKITKPCKVIPKSVMYQTDEYGKVHEHINVVQKMPITINSFKYKLNLKDGECLLKGLFYNIIHIYIYMS